MVRKTDIDDRLVRLAWWTLAIIVFGLVLTIRVRLLGIPLERDEGEYAYAGQLILQGIPPYKLVYNMKFPGTYAAYALVMSIFGQTIIGIHIGLLLVNAGTIVLIFFLGRRLINTTAGISAAASYAILSLSPFVLGFAAHASHFVMFPVLAGTLLLLDQRGRRHLCRLFASSLLFGVALLMKQPAASFVVFAVMYVLWKQLHHGRTLADRAVPVLIFSCGAILPFLITCLLLWAVGVFNQFWFWTIDYAREYGSLVPFSQVLQVFSQRIREVIGANWPMWILGAIGAVAGLWIQRMRASTLFVLGFLLFSALALSAGLYFRHHYFIFILPAVSLLAGAAIGAISDVRPGRALPAVLVSLIVAAASLAVPILSYRQLFFGVSPIEASRMIYSESPFAEAIRIGDYVREHTNADETIAVLGSEPEIYFYSHRHSATGYIYTYGLMEPQKYAHRMQEEMISEIERRSPKYLVSVLMNDSWLERPQSDRLIFTWANDYAAQNYSPDGFVNIKPTETDYFFGEIPQSVDTLKNYILIYKRKL